MLGSRLNGALMDCRNVGKPLRSMSSDGGNLHLEVVELVLQGVDASLVRVALGL